MCGQEMAKYKHKLYQKLALPPVVSWDLRCFNLMIHNLRQCNLTSEDRGMDHHLVLFPPGQRTINSYKYEALCGPVGHRSL